MRTKYTAFFLCFLLTRVLVATAEEEAPLDSTRPPVLTSAEKCEDAEPHFSAPFRSNQAIRQRATGWVEVQYDLDGTGRATNLSVAKAAPVQVFDRSSKFAIETSKFRPGIARTGCKAVVFYGPLRETGISGQYKSEDSINRN